MKLAGVHSAGHCEDESSKLPIILHNGPLSHIGHDRSRLIGCRYTGSNGAAQSLDASVVCVDFSGICAACGVRAMLGDGPIERLRFATALLAIRPAASRTHNSQYADWRKWCSPVRPDGSADLRSDPNASSVPARVAGPWSSSLSADVKINKGLNRRGKLSFCSRR